ncbi:exosome complex component RRP45-like protein, partial [Euroglyphus maynei]
MSRTVPNCNRSFLIESLLENKRIDNRTFYQSRDLQVNFGRTFGSCFVQLGNTVMYASTEATLDEPRITRPSEGRFKVIINIGAGGKEKWLRNIERSQPTEAILTTRLLEKIINRINVLDLESLCLVTGKTVWCICVKLVLLNYDGNLIEAASIATIASLMHFKRPDATVTPDGDIIVHSYEERNPIPITLFHYPICVTFQFMDRTHLKKILTENQEILPEQHEHFVRKAAQLLICDPTEEEEDFLQNVLIICANVYKEIVAIQSIGPLSLRSFSQRLLRSCTEKAFERVRYVTNYLKSTLQMHINSGGGGQQQLFERYGFYEAMLNGDLSIIRDYDRHPVLGDDNNHHHNREDD